MTSSKDWEVIPGIREHFFNSFRNDSLKFDRATNFPRFVTGFSNRDRPYGKMAKTRTRTSRSRIRRSRKEGLVCFYKIEEVLTSRGNLSMATGFNQKITNSERIPRLKSESHFLSSFATLSHLHFQTVLFFKFCEKEIPLFTCWDVAAHLELLYLSFQPDCGTHRHTHTLEGMAYVCFELEPLRCSLEVLQPGTKINESCM